MVENSNEKFDEKKIISKSELKNKIEAKLMSRGIGDASCATDEKIYQAVVYAIKDLPRRFSRVRGFFLNQERRRLIQ